MILVGELEYTNKMMAPDGYQGFLFVGENSGKFYYNIAVDSYGGKSAWFGNNYISETNLSVTEFLQRVVDEDIAIGRGVGIRFGDDVGIRLKGMKEWIKRKKASK